MKGEPGTWWRRLFDEDYLQAYSHLAERAAEEAESIRKLLGLEPGDRGLDLPCGQGRHILPLQEQGIRVTGLDLSTILLREARSAGCRGLTRGDMRRLPFRDGVFDAAWNVFTSFGYFGDEEDARVLEEVARVLRPGGRFLLETINRESVLRQGDPFPRQLWHEKEDLLLLEEIDFDGAGSRLVTRRILVRPDGSRREQHFAIRAYTERELREALEAAGLEILEAGGGMLDHGNRHPVEARRRTYLARRGEE